MAAVGFGPSNSSSAEAGAVCLPPRFLTQPFYWHPKSNLRGQRVVTDSAVLSVGLSRYAKPLVNLGRLAQSETLRFRHAGMPINRRAGLALRQPTRPDAPAHQSTC